MYVSFSTSRRLFMCCSVGTLAPEKCQRFLRLTVGVPFSRRDEKEFERKKKT
jgi:hypothetical protein